MADKMFVTAVRTQAKQGSYAHFGNASGATTDSLDPAGYPDTFSQGAF
jgi:peptide/nickel transport system substrate-binding protein